MSVFTPFYISNADFNGKNIKFVKEYKIIIILSKKLILFFAINSAFKIRVALIEFILRMQNIRAKPCTKYNPHIIDTCCSCLYKPS